jgi:hypothetical protein
LTSATDAGQQTDARIVGIAQRFRELVETSAGVSAVLMQVDSPVPGQDPVQDSAWPLLGIEVHKTGDGLIIAGSKPINNRASGTPTLDDAFAVSVIIDEAALCSLDTDVECSEDDKGRRTVGFVWTDQGCRWTASFMFRPMEGSDKA